MAKNSRRRRSAGRQSRKPKLTRRAFVSHSSPDDRYVQELVRFLQTIGYDEVFNDSHTIKPDELCWERIEKGILGCDAFVFVLSHASVKSCWVDREVQFAREQEKKVIPVRIDDCKLPSSFNGRDVNDRAGKSRSVTRSISVHHASPGTRRKSSSAATNGSMRLMVAAWQPEY